MRIDIPEEEYPELTRYLCEPKRKMKFLYFLETLFEDSNFDPIRDGLHVKPQGQASVDVSALGTYLESIGSSIQELTKAMDGKCIGHFPTEHVVHEVVKEASSGPKKTPLQDDEEDWSDATGIDFSAAIAAFDD